MGLLASGGAGAQFLARLDDGVDAEVAAGVPSPSGLWTFGKHPNDRMFRFYSIHPRRLEVRRE